MTGQKKIDFKNKIRRQLDCTPKRSFENEIYRKFITSILSRHPKYIRITCVYKNDEITIKSLLHPYYSESVNNKKIQTRVLRWFRWFKKMTEKRDLIEYEDGDWIHYA